MFISDTHLPQVLSPADYTSREQFDREMQSLFLPGWHCLATIADLPRDGDYLTTEYLDHPLIIWRAGGEFRTFLNVCPHRFTRISGKSCGHAPEQLQCQYHGWEFDCDGHTRKIPDAPSFKPMTKGALKLTKFRTETVGQLIFVSLAEDGPDLREHLGPGYELAAELCSEDRGLAASLDYVVEANWKCRVENALESYHVDMVHSATFGQTPDADCCTHELEPNWTTFATDQPAVKPIERFLDRLTFRLAGVEPDYEYKHYHYYPQQMFGKMRLFTWTETTIPLSPNRTRVLGKFFCHGGNRPLTSRWLAPALASWERKFFQQLAIEDGGILPDVQRGLEAGRHPSEGMISAREERCHHFQQYIKQSTQTLLTEPARNTDGFSDTHPAETRQERLHPNRELT